MFWIRLSGWLFVLIEVGTAVVMGVGSKLPEAKTSVASGVIHATPEEVWAALEGVSREPEWWPGVEGVASLPDRDGQACWRRIERGIGGSIGVPMCVVASEVPQRWVAAVADRTDGPRLPFGATWSFVLEPVADGTRVTVEERRTTNSAMWRFFDRYVSHEERRPAEMLTGLERVTRR